MLSVVNYFGVFPLFTITPYAMEHKRGQILHGDTRKIVYNVIKYFEEEKNMARYHALEYSNARAGMATGLSKNTITRIKKEGIYLV